MSEPLSDRGRQCYTVREVAALERVAEDTVLGWLASGRLRGHRSDEDRGRWLVPGWAVDEFQRKGAKPAGRLVEMRRRR